MTPDVLHDTIIYDETSLFSNFVRRDRLERCRYSNGADDAKPAKPVCGCAGGL